MNEYEHQRFRDWEVSCAQKDVAIMQLTAERDALKAEVDATSLKWDEEVLELRADNEQLRLELAAANRAVGNNVRENEWLRAELKCHAAGEQGSVVANRKPGRPKDPQAETPVEAVRRFQHDYPLDTSDPYTKLFAIAELRTAQLTELREAAVEAMREYFGIDAGDVMEWWDGIEMTNPGRDSKAGKLLDVLAKVTSA